MVSLHQNLIPLMAPFKSGFVNIIGFPNAGKSTLINHLVKEKISIVTRKPQTTRLRVLGIVNGENYQIVFSDTPGILEPHYELQQSMMVSVNQALSDADVILFIIDITDSVNKHLEFLEKIISLNVPFITLLNKADLVNEAELNAKVDAWKNHLPEGKTIIISALHGFNIGLMMEDIIALLPEGEAFYPEDMLTDKSEKFIASELIREQIFIHYKEEIPYSTEVIVTDFDDTTDILRIKSEIYVNRESQKPILIGKGGSALKLIGTEARLEMEKFFKKKVFLEIFVKVRENWRDKKLYLKQFGYNS